MKIALKFFLLLILISSACTQEENQLINQLSETTEFLGPPTGNDNINFRNSKSSQQELNAIQLSTSYQILSNKKRLCH